jgi:hypothetical protein
MLSFNQQSILCSAMKLISCLFAMSPDKYAYVNLFMAASNLPGLLILYQPMRIEYKALSVCTIISSFLMHISETKHGLVGIYPFNKYSWHFLQLDRIFAIFSVIVVLCILYERWNKTSTKLILFGCVGLFLNMLSENLFRDNITGFVVTHSLWHWIAYTTYAKMCKLE